MKPAMRSNRPPLVAVGRSLPLQGLALLVVSWMVLGGRAGLTAPQAVVAVTAGGLVCVGAVWVACRTHGVRCGVEALLVALIAAGAGGVAVAVGMSGIGMMALLTVPGALAWGVCWPGTWSRRVIRVVRGAAALPLAGLAWVGMFVVPTTPALVLLAAFYLSLPLVVHVGRWIVASPPRLVAASGSAVAVSGLLVYTVDHQLSFATGVAMAELGAWLAAHLVLVLAATWPRLPPRGEAQPGPMPGEGQQAPGRTTAGGSGGQR